MRKLLICCCLLALALSLAAPARADVLWEPNNSFYARHADECEYLGRRFYANGPEGYITLWDAPGGYLVEGQYQNGFALSVHWVWENWGCVYAFDGEKVSVGWVPLSDLELVYDYIAFEEEYGELIEPYQGQFADYDGDVEEIRFYEYPGAAEPKETWGTEDVLDDLTGRGGDSYIQSVFVDEDGLTWGYVGYLYGSRNLWFCLDDPGGTDFPIREVEVPDLIPARTPRLPVMAYVPYALVAVVVIVTAVLLRRSFHRKRGQ